ncbi:unnamed protein product [Orchesella dallaii]|uniref:Uncharacterized protein n=1 Tax=Orchesella dallaii TaxID=48710 RepID=A0ABP1S5S2_9HEXA
MILIWSRISYKHTAYAQRTNNEPTENVTYYKDSTKPCNMSTLSNALTANFSTRIPEKMTTVTVLFISCIGNLNFWLQELALGHLDLIPNNSTTSDRHPHQNVIRNEPT